MLTKELNIHVKNMFIRISARKMQLLRLALLGSHLTPHVSFFFKSETSKGHIITRTSRQRYTQARLYDTQCHPLSIQVKQRQQNATLN